MKPKPRWMKSVIAAAKVAGETPLFFGNRKRSIVAAPIKPARA